MPVSQQPTLVFLHAFPLDADMWNTCCRPSNNNWPAEFPNLIGFGGTHRSENVSLSEDARSIARKFDALKIERAVLCGASMGGYVAFELWRQYRSRVAGLVLVDTRADADSPETRTRRGTQASRILREGAEPVVRELLFSLIGPSTRLRDPDIDERMYRMAKKISPDTIRATLGALGARNDSSDLLETIDVPTLVMVGEEDAVTPPAVALTMAARIPNAELEIIPAAGHLVPLEQPQMFSSRLQRFLHSHFS